MEIVLVAAMARHHVIGRDGGMPWHLPADLAHFKRVTLNHPVIMGRKTFESIGFALPKRRNIVVTRNPEAEFPGAEVATSLEEALARVADSETVMVIGGGQLYREALPRATRLELTFIDAEIDGDTAFPAWSSEQWGEVSREHRPADEKNAHDLAFVTLERKG
ncbi:type 3 dihydrofolate reductase [Natronospira bacteriovora]|uniref:Dihydrofolate reductase n=1 Tax=Natronospira bacteriovora TaxID=3069753 RepID=A0ABU0W8V6_9GAMM|nr:type 3 dihydrofolate reductase [Natronospira sp. AB-CW4]MDQ2070462.1 type 3 dihydrofolate reductase [Natronospira sp. AB-CW4]